MGQTLLQLGCLVPQLKVTLNPLAAPRTQCAVFCFVLIFQEGNGFHKENQGTHSFLLSAKDPQVVHNPI